MRKSVLKRIKFTRTGKALHRKPGKNHFNAKASRKTQLRGKGMGGFSARITKTMQAYRFN